MRRFRVALFLVCALGCGPAPIPPDLQLSLTRRANEVVAKATATDEQGEVGTGSVLFESNAGSLKSGASVTLDAFGTAVTTFTCDVATEPDCATVRVTAEWTPSGAKMPVTASSSATAPTGAGGGAGGGTGGGAGGGAGFMGGPVTTTCSTNSTRPGVNISCCYADGSSRPPCDAIRVLDGETFQIPFTGNPSGGMVMIPITFDYTRPFTGQSSCEAASVGFKADTTSVGGSAETIVTLIAGQRGLIDSMGGWGPVTATPQPSFSNVYLAPPVCADLYMGGTGGSSGIYVVQVMRGAFFDVGSNRFSTASNQVFTFTLTK